MSKYQGGMMGSLTNVSIGTLYTGRANGIWALPHQIQAKQAATWAQSQSAPGAPTITSVVAKNQSVDVYVSAPTVINGDAVTGYTVTSSGGQVVTAVSSPITVTGLTSGTNYTFTAVANSNSGPSVASNTSSSVSPYTVMVPFAPTIGTATIQYNVANVSFTQPSNDGYTPITGYTATSSPGGITGVLNQAGSGTIVVSGLTAGVSYTFTVTATNMIGVSMASAASNAVAASAGGSAGNNLWGWGYNNAIQLGLGNTTSYSSPKQVSASADWLKIAGGYYSTLAIKSNGTLWGWGANNYGQLGLGDLVNRTSPVQIGALTDWTTISNNNHSCAAIKTNGTLWMWGSNGDGQLGLGVSGSYAGRSSPTQVGTLTDWLNVSCGYWHTVAVKTDGTLWTWGLNNVGQLASFNNTSRSSPVQVGALTNWSATSSGYYHTVGIKTDGTLWGWGGNSSGQIAQYSGFTFSWSSPAQIGSLSNWSSVRCARTSTFGISATGALWAWGNNNYGQLGLGDTSNRTDPTQVGALTNWLQLASGGYAHTSAIKTNGTLWTWGYNGNGQLGLGNTANYSSPKQVGALSNWVSTAHGQVYIIALQASPPAVPGAPINVYATRMPNATSVTVSFTAPTSNGGLTISKYTATSSPGGFTGVLNQAGSGTITVSGLDANTAYTFTVAATNFMGTGPASSSVATVAPATLLAWGGGLYGKTALNTQDIYAYPTQVGLLTNWKRASIGWYHSVFIKTDNTLWVSGSGSNGLLGLGNTTYYSSPKQVGALSNWDIVSTGQLASLAIKTDNTLWSWGGGYYGQLGLNNTTYYSSPKQVGALTNWLNVSAGQYGVIAVKTDGTLWTWGKNLSGQLGLGDLIQRNSPVQVGSLTSWCKVSSGRSHVAAIKFDGTLWMWGYNWYGQLGLGSSQVDISSPSQVGTNTNWSSVSAIDYNHTLATKTDGTLWAWGGNSVGQLGLGNTTNFSSPKQVGALTNWLSVTGGYSYTLAVKTNGTLWAWGKNQYSQLGLGNSTDYSSPVQVGSGASWLIVCGGGGSQPGVLATRIVSSPDAPTITSATRSTGSTTATISFTAPTYNGGYAITSYTATSSPDGITGSISQAGSGSITVTGLNAGTTYTFTVTATNSIGTSVAGNSISTVVPAKLWAWGQNDQGQVGNSVSGSGVGQSTPDQVGALTNWLNVAAGRYFSTAVKTDGTLWTWGQNNSGQLGLGNTTSYSSPKQVGALTNWLTVAAGDLHTVGLKKDGTLWSWGRNLYGQLGLGNSGAGTYRSSPTQIGTLATWSKISVNYWHNMAIKTDGTLWMWGYNAWGQLGVSDTTDRPSPVQVGTSTNWSKIACGKGVAAIKTDGTLWTWGNNDYFQLGLGVGKNGDKNSPNQVGALTDWAEVYSNFRHMIAIKTDGTLWAWGSNDQGQSGLGDSGYNFWRNSPVQVGALTNWLSAVAGSYHTAAIKTNGTLWTWGMNTSSYFLGLGNITTYYSSPKQVGSLTTWRSLSAYRHTLALQNA